MKFQSIAERKLHKVISLSRRRWYVGYQSMFLCQSSVDVISNCMCGCMYVGICKAVFTINLELKFSAKNSKFERGNLPNESLDQEEHLKHVFGVGVG